MSHDNLSAGNALSLERIRNVLNRLEDTIIFSLIERSQFAHNPRMYQRGAISELKQLKFDGSWLDWFLLETETFHAKARRYTSPDEYPFTPMSELPQPVLSVVDLPPILYPNSINVNPSILAFYTRTIVPRVSRLASIAHAASRRAQGIKGDDEYEDDGNYGSAAIIDVESLQAISKRVHYGKFVSEAKFVEDPSAFIPHILTPNPAKLEALITKPAVEKKLFERVKRKAAGYAQDFTADGPSETIKIDIDTVVELYEHFIIPLTKEVEVEYLLKRLDGLSPEAIDALAKR